MVIGLSGKAGAGKNTVADILVNDFGYKRIAFSDKIKRCLLALNPIVEWSEGDLKIDSVRLSSVVQYGGWDSAKLYPEVRRLLQHMGTEVGREMFGDMVWINLLFDTVDISEGDKIVITGVRFPNEFEEVKWLLGKVWRIERDTLENSHLSETALDKFKFDRVIENNGTLEELAIKVREAME